jgi:hypothetical protein
MTPEELAKERTMLVGKCDQLVDTYHAGAHDMHSLIEMRRELAVWSYRLSAHTKDVHGQAGLGYLMRKYRIAESIVDARASDAKKAMNILEQEAMKMPSVVAAHKDEIWAEAEKEALKSKLDFVKKVLESMNQELSILSHEAKTAHFQNTST